MKSAPNLIREAWPKIRIVTVKGCQFYQVDARKKGTNGKQETFSTRNEAEKRAGEIARDFGNQGKEGLSMDSSLRVFAQKADEILKPYGKSILQAAEHYRDYLEAQKTKYNSKVIGELADEWLADKEGNTKETLRFHTIKGIKKGVNFMKKHWAAKKIKELTIEEVTTEADKKPTIRTRRNMLSLVSQFFNWCIQKQYCDENPYEEILKSYKPEDGEVVILTVDKSAEFMRVCESKFSTLTLYHALQLFGGLRPECARLLTWENVFEKEGYIYVPKAISKVCDDRNVTLTPTLKLWLQAFKGERTGFITPQTNFQNVIRKFRFAMGYAVKVPQRKNGAYIYHKNEGAPKYVPDCCRHSYASYMIAIGTHKPILAEQMGNSVAVIKKHYKKIVPREEGGKFFGIIPCEFQDAAKAKKEKMQSLINRAKSLKQQ